MLNIGTKQISGLLVTDFDGTIKPSGGPVGEADKAAMIELGRKGWFRVVATGRSLFAFARDWDPSLELDALIFSSGLGLCTWGNMGPGPLIYKNQMAATDAAAAVNAAAALPHGFFLYNAPPDNHHFYYQAPPDPPAGFNRRLDMYEAHARPWPPEHDNEMVDRLGPFAQVLIMIKRHEIDEAEAKFKTLAPDFSFVRSTSPFSDDCLWLEVYPQGVSKGGGAAYLAEALNLPKEKTVALGNDFNDLDLLAWAGHSFVAEDAPDDLIKKYAQMPPAGQGGLALVYNDLIKRGVI